MMKRPRIVLSLLALPLALGLAACDKAAESSAPSGEPIAKIAPPAGKAWGDVVERTPEGGHRMGNPEAPIKLIEFGSMTCSHCADFAEQSAAELRDNFIASGRVSFEFRNFVVNPIDITTSLLARCGPPESFFALTDQLFANQAATFERLNAAGPAANEAAMNQPEAKRFIALGEVTGLTEFVSSRGVAKDQANACLADLDAAKALAQRAKDDGDKYQIEGTPTFLVNGTKFQGGWPELKAHLETLGAR
jgi:protein-disulfide isomerase